MKKFTPYAKLSKRLKHEFDRHKRGSWGGLNPVTRMPENPKAYDRKKTQDWSRDDDFNSVFFA